MTWQTLAVTVAIGAGGMYYLNQEKKAMLERTERAQGTQNRMDNLMVAERQDGSYGKPKVGGPFRLIDSETGKEVSDQDFLGKFMILYFGFTHCPDVCPDELEKMSRAISKMGTLAVN
jgi:protein SCO1/2